MQGTSKIKSLNPERLLSIDVFRGIAIIGMILVNAQDNLPEVYYHLRHAKWNDWTFADLVFPFFLFIMGVVIPISFAKRLERGDSKKKVYLHVIKRSIVIFGLGILLNTFPYLSILSIRIPGVLQRIALCYLFASVITLQMRVRGQVITALGLLIIYWLLMKTVPVPGYGPGILTLHGNLAAYIDKLLLNGHLMDPDFDPEGVLSTMPAVSTTLMGGWVGNILKSTKDPVKKIKILLLTGFISVVAGLVIDIWFPINKYLWSSSYAIFTAGIASICLVTCYWLIDVKGFYRWSMPFAVYGSNALVVYVLSSVVERIMKAKRLTLPDGSTEQLQTYIYEKFFLSWASPVNASLFYALTHVLIWLGFAVILYRKKIFIKV